MRTAAEHEDSQSISKMWQSHLSWLCTSCSPKKSPRNPEGGIVAEIATTDEVVTTTDITSLTTTTTTKLTDGQIGQLKLRQGLLEGWCSAKYMCDILPTDLDPVLAKKIREEFYKATGHCLVTPENCEEFLRVHARWAELKDRRTQWDTQEYWSGSSRFSATAFRRNMYVGFPVDARYGWNLMNSDHRRLLDKVDNFFRPITNLNAPECTAWSVASVTRDPVERQADRDSQKPMLEWLHQKHRRQVQQLRGFMDENPTGSDLWTQRGHWLRMSTTSASKGNEDVSALMELNAICQNFRSRKAQTGVPTCP